MVTFLHIISVCWSRVPLCLGDMWLHKHWWRVRVRQEVLLRSLQTLLYMQESKLVGLHCGQTTQFLLAGRYSAGRTDYLRTTLVSQTPQHVSKHASTAE